VSSRKHIFSDILAYSCLFNECSVAKIFFEDSDAMMSHLEQYHDLDVSISAVTCPLCLEYTSDDRGALALHFARHMEEIALAIIPSGVDSDDESVNETPSEAETGHSGGESANEESEAETVDLTAHPNTVKDRPFQVGPVSELSSLEGSSDDDQEEEDEVTRCICGLQEFPGLQYDIDTGSPTPDDDLGGLFIQCDSCKVWQHGGCVGILDEAASPDEYFCEVCRQDLHEKMTSSKGRTYSRYITIVDDRLANMSAAAEGTRSSSWDDDILIQARAQGLNWNQIAQKHFPNKSPHACRKRYERLMVRRPSLKKKVIEKSAPETRSADVRHWSTEEKHDFEKNLARFGTDWRVIADRMDTKTSTEVENYYLHLVETGRSDLEDVAQGADARLELERLREESEEKDSRLRQLEQAVMALQQLRGPDSPQTDDETYIPKYAGHPQTPDPAQSHLDESSIATLQQLRQENEGKDLRLRQLEEAVMALQQRRDDRPYKCNVKGCEKLKGFTYHGGLIRHEREVHKMHGGTKKKLFCPFTDCKRNTGAGFTRKENLTEHLRQVHRRVPRSEEPQEPTSIHDDNGDRSERQRGYGGEFACPFDSCKDLYGFYQEANLTEHIRAVHGNSNMPTDSTGSSSTSAAISARAPESPDPAKAAPIILREDQNGVLWMAFEYSRDGMKMEYTIRTDTESVNVDELSEDFKAGNCLYTRAPQANDFSRHCWATTRDTLGWALAQLNPCLRGNRQLLRRAVDGCQTIGSIPRPVSTPGAAHSDWNRNRADSRSDSLSEQQVWDRFQERGRSPYRPSSSDQRSNRS
jgi:hypothetical protein